MRKVEQVLVYNNFIKMDVLKAINNSLFTNSPNNYHHDVNIYIDMYKMMMDLYQPGLEISSFNIVAALMINLCAHMRSFYLRNYGVNSNIFLVYSDLSARYGKTFIPNYNETNDIKVQSNPRIAELINSNLEVLGLLCPYLPNIYFVRGIYEPSVMILDLIYKEEALGNMAPNIVLTRDDMAMQLPAYHKNIAIIQNNKRTGDMYHSTWSNSIRMYLHKTGRDKLLATESASTRIDTLNHGLLNAIIAMSNLTCRNIRSLYDINKAITIIGSAVARGSIINGYHADPNVLYSGLFVADECKIDRTSFAFRYKAVDIISAHTEYMYTPFAKDTSYRVDLDDPHSVQAINNEYFRDNPLDLNRL